ncbi:MAG: hypothetical protein AAF678_09915, partial [Pseudomonadota bacterium]
MYLSDTPSPVERPDLFFAAPLVDPDPADGWTDPSAWAAAEACAGRALAEAAAAVARLDERLAGAGASRDGLALRLALGGAGRLLWAEGSRLRWEKLALALHERLGVADADSRVLARARWAVRRMLATAEDLVVPSGVRAFLGLADVSEFDGLDAGGWEAGGSDAHGFEAHGSEAFADLADDLDVKGPDGVDLQDWCGAIRADLHPLTRAAMGWHLWRAWGLTVPERLLEPAVAAGRLATEGQGASPALLVHPASGSGLDAAARLERWLAAATDAAQAALAEIDRVRLWRERAGMATDGLQGRGAPALIGLLARLPVVSAKVISAELGVSGTQARHLMDRFDGLGL